MALRNIRPAETIALQGSPSGAQIPFTGRSRYDPCGVEICLAQLPMIRCELILLLTVCGVPHCATIAFSDERAASSLAKPTQVGMMPEGLHEVIAQLGSPDFEVRQRAMELLQDITAEQIPLLADAIQNHPSNEVAQRCIELLARWYATGDRDAGLTRQSSEVLESAAKSDRWFVAEAARDILERHWKRRVEIACLKLQELGVPMLPTNPVKLWEPAHYDSGPFGRIDPISDRHLKIYADEYWKAQPERFELLRRLSPLVSQDFLISGSQVSMYVLDGHPLRQPELAELKGIFGDTRVQERGRVCLGISHQQQDGGGVRVSGVSPDSSADKAAILENDLLLRFEGKPLKDFEQLIESLKAFRPGDEVTFLVQRFSVRSSFEIKVKLQGWYER